MDQFVEEFVENENAKIVEYNTKLDAGHYVELFPWYEQKSEPMLKSRSYLSLFQKNVYKNESKHLYMYM